MLQTFFFYTILEFHIYFYYTRKSMYSLPVNSLNMVYLLYFVVEMRNLPVKFGKIGNIFLG